MSGRSEYNLFFGREPIYHSGVCTKPGANYDPLPESPSSERVVIATIRFNEEGVAISDNQGPLEEKVNRNNT
jgi:hypothetical protein